MALTNGRTKTAAILDIASLWAITPTPDVSSYQEFKSYSPFHDAVMARISMADERGSEFWIAIPAQSGKPYRTAKAEALEMIQEAMTQGCQPGEVQRA